MAVLQKPFGRLTSMEDDAPLIQPGQLWQYGNGTMIVARNVAELNLIVERVTFFSCVCLMASMARSVNCLGQKNAVQVHLIGAKPIVQVKR